MPIRIMIADDHCLFREGLIKLFEGEEEFEIVGEVENGDEVLEQIPILKPDILLLDIHMPKKNGFEVYVKIKELGLNTKIIMLTYHNEMDYLIKAINQGVSGYVLKQISFIELKKAIIAVNKGETFVQSNMLSQLTSKMTQQEKDHEKIMSLTRREMEVLRLLAVGMYNKEIATQLNISERTVKNHISNIFKKISVTDRTQAAVFAIKNSIINV